MTKVAILGYGTVGSGVYEVLKKNKDIITNKLGDEIQVKYVLDLREFEVRIRRMSTQSVRWRAVRAYVRPTRSWWRSMVRS